MKARQTKRVFLSVRLFAGQTCQSLVVFVLSALAWVGVDKSSALDYANRRLCIRYHTELTVTNTQVSVIC